MTKLDIFKQYEIAILIPCYNEALTITNVIQSFQNYLPSAKIYIYNNNSTDNTASIAQEMGAIVVNEPRRGKGNVIRRMFADVEADIYVLIDGDNTYDISAANTLIEKLIVDQLDMVVGRRVDSETEAYRKGHRFGNHIFNAVVRICFGEGFSDIFSGYRVFSRRYIKSFPIMVSGFEIETEMAVHSLELKLPTAELPVTYISRPLGSESKLSSYKDGFKILSRIILLVKNIRPMTFFGVIAFLFLLAAAILAEPLIITYLQTGLVPRMPTGVFVVGLGIIAFLSFFSGVILSTIVSFQKELKYLHYLSIKRFREK